MGVTVAGLRSLKMERILRIVVMVICFAFASTLYVNQHTCLAKENPITFRIEELDCKYRGPGVYMYNGSGSVFKLQFDRMTNEGHIRIPLESHLKQVEIMEGTLEACNMVSAPTHVT